MAVKKDLSQVKDYWIKHNITYKAVADMFSMSVETVRKRAYKEKWEDQKNIYKSSLLATTQTEPEEEKANIQDIKDLSFKAISKSLKLINLGLNDTLPADTNRLKTLTGALSDILKMCNGAGVKLIEEPQEDILQRVANFVEMQIKN